MSLLSVVDLFALARCLLWPSIPACPLPFGVKGDTDFGLSFPCFDVRCLFSIFGAGDFPAPLYGTRAAPSQSGVRHRANRGDRHSDSRSIAFRSITGPSHLGNSVFYGCLLLRVSPFRFLSFRAPFGGPSFVSRLVGRRVPCLVSTTSVG